MNKEKTTVEFIKESLEQNRNMLNTPQAAQTTYLGHIVILLAALDDDLKQLIHILEARNEKEEKK